MRARETIYSWGFPTLIAVITALPLIYAWQGNYYSTDLAETVYHAKEILAGRVPYLEFFTHHFGGYILPFVVWDSFFETRPLSIFFLQLGFQLTYIFFTFKAASELFSDPHARRWVVLLTATIGWFPLMFGMMFNYQSVSLPILMLVIWLGLRAAKRETAIDLALFGLTFGLMVTFDQRLVLFALIAIAVLKERAFRMRDLIITACSVILVPAIGLAFLEWKGALDEFFYQTVYYPLTYRNAAIAGLQYKVWQFHLRLLLPQPAVLLSIVGLAFAITLENRNRIFLTLLLLSSVAYVHLGGRPFNNYLLIFGPLILLSHGYLFKYRGYIQKRLPIVQVLIVLEIVLNLHWFVHQKAANVSVSKSSITEIGNALAESTGSEDRILVWGYCPQLYLLADRFTDFRDMGLVTIAGSPFHLSPSSTANVDPRMLNEFKALLISSPPKAIIMKVEDKKAGEFTWGEGSACSFGSPDAERKSGVGFVREYIDKNYSLKQTWVDKDLTLGLYLSDFRQ